MIEKQYIESVLKANGVPPTAKDEEIRSVLISARFDTNDVDTALLILKQNTNTNETHVDTLHKVFHSDERLSPADISTLLGVEVKVTKDDIIDLVERRESFAKRERGLILVVAVLIAVALPFFYMYMTASGVFFSYE